MGRGRLKLAFSWDVSSFALILFMTEIAMSTFLFPKKQVTVNWRPGP